jgi:methylmalonyl-CoA mutase cobalamin-binding subunit
VAAFADALEQAGGDATTAGAASILADAGGVPTQVAPKALEVNAAVADLSVLAAGEREVLRKAQALLDKVGMRGVSLLGPEAVPEDEGEDE